MEWFDPNLKLPPEGVYVLAHISSRPRASRSWNDNQDKVGIFYKVVKLLVGISRTQRAALRSDDPRKNTYTESDQDGNNLRPYSWKEVVLVPILDKKSSLGLIIEYSDLESRK